MFRFITLSIKFAGAFIVAFTEVVFMGKYGKRYGRKNI